MAYTVTTNKKTVFGDQRVHFLDVTADAATQAVATGLDNINGFSFTHLSMTTVMSGVHIAYNSNASGVETRGTIGLSGFVSGDHFLLTVYGT